MSRAVINAILIYSVLIAPCVFAQSSGRSLVSPSQIVKYENPWSGTIVLDISRATDINHSLVLNPNTPDERKEYAAILIGTLKYKLNSQHSLSLTGAVSQDFVSRPSDPDSTKPQPKNMRFGYAYRSSQSRFGALPVEWPLSVSLPTTSQAQEMGMIASYRLMPSLIWPFLDIYSFIYSLEANLNLSHPLDRESNQETILEASTTSVIHTFILTIQLTERVSLSQSGGITLLAKNIKNPIGMDQTGSSFNISSGVSFFFKPRYSVDIMVSQSSPLQGNGAGAVRVYEDNTYRPYHIAQSMWSITGTYLF